MRRRRSVIRCIMLAALLFSARPGGAPARAEVGDDVPLIAPRPGGAGAQRDDPAGDPGSEAVAEVEARREQLRSSAAAVQSSLPLLAVTHVSEVLRVRIEGGNFVIRTPLPASAGQGYVRALVAEAKRPLLVRVVRNENGAAGPFLAAVPDEFILQLDDYTQPRRVVTLAVSQSRAGLFGLFYTETTPAGSRTVQYTAQRHPMLPGGGMADLTVTEPGFSAGPPGRLTAPDAATFLRAHREAANKYLRPLFAAIGQDAAFAPDPLVAAQVFPNASPPDAAVRQTIDLLLPELGAADYRRRDRATTALQALGRGGAVALLRMDRSKLTPEQGLRVEQVLSPLGFLRDAEAKRLRRDADFLLDCQYADDPAVRRPAAAALKALLGGAGVVNPDAPASERTDAVARVRRTVGASQ